MAFAAVAVTAATTHQTAASPTAIPEEFSFLFFGLDCCFVFWVLFCLFPGCCKQEGSTTSSRTPHKTGTPVWWRSTILFLAAADRSAAKVQQDAMQQGIVCIVMHNKEESAKWCSTTNRICGGATESLCQTCLQSPVCSRGSFPGASNKIMTAPGQW